MRRAASPHPTPPHLASPHCRRDIGAPFAVDDTGAVLPAELEALRQREQAAAARRDYRLAGQLQDVETVLAPRPGGRLTLADCAPASVEDQHEFFLENGVSEAARPPAPHTPPPTSFVPVVLGKMP